MAIPVAVAFMASFGAFMPIVVALLPARPVFVPMPCHLNVRCHLNMGGRDRSRCRGVDHTKTVASSPMDNLSALCDIELK
jgi:hypothetical protein